MKRLIILLNAIIAKHKSLKKWRKVVTFLAAVMTFATTYALILPAITVEKNHTEEVAGMYLDSVKAQDDLLEENALLPEAAVIAADQENAVTFPYTDDGITATAIFSTDEEIPEGAELVVTPVEQESEEYADLSRRSTALLDKEFIYDVITCSFYDFALVFDNVDVTPKTGLVDILIIFHNNTVKHADDMIFAGRFARTADDTDGFTEVAADYSPVSADTLISANPDESSVIELKDEIISVLSLKGNDLAYSDSLVGILAGHVDEETMAAADETDAEIPDYSDAQEESNLDDSPVSDGEGAAPAVRTLTVAGKDYTVTLTYDETSEIPEGAVLTASEIAEDSKEYQTYLEETKKAMGLAEEETLPRFAARFFDIKIIAGDKEFIPKAGVSVEITYEEPLAENPETEVNAVHFADEKAKAEVIEANTTAVQDGGTATVEFTAESFSVYGVIYTVDFHYAANGKIYNFSIPGGGFVSLQHLVEVLGIANSDTYDENVSDSEGKSQDLAEEAINLNNAFVSEKTREFVADVTNVEFSDPNLVWIGKAGESTTIGHLKDKNGLECQYSIELSEKKINEINCSTVEAGDWALISMLPFRSKETLTVTMKNGDQFMIRVKDAQISTNVLTADGKKFIITITFDETAEIPAGTMLTATEILPGSDEYIEYLGHTWSEVNKEYLAQWERMLNHTDADETEILCPVNIDSARFFDIRFIYMGEEIEPMAPVHVDIWLSDGLSNTADEPITGVVHFPKNRDAEKENPACAEIELIESVETFEDASGIVEFSYNQESFSVVGTYIGQKTLDAGVKALDPTVALPKFTALRAEAKPVLDELTADKSIRPNNDGTYTLSLNVKGDAEYWNQVTKANVLIMLDRSTSMYKGAADEGTATLVTGTPQTSGVTYYGVDGTDNTLWPLNYSDGTWYLTRTGNVPYEYTGDFYESSNRLQAAQAALDELIGALVSKNDPDDPDKDDIIEVCVKSFASARGNSLNGYITAGATGAPSTWTGTTDTGWLTSYGDAENPDTLYNAVHNMSVNNGTNWEDALMYAKQTAEAMLENQPNEDVFIIFLTDGEPTAIYGENSTQNNNYGAFHYESDGNPVYISTTHMESHPEDAYRAGSMYALGFAKQDEDNNWDAQNLVDDHLKFYSIFTFNNDARYAKYLQHLVNYAYGVDGVDDDPADTQDTPVSNAFFTNAENIAVLRQSFDNIWSSVFDSLSYGDVKIVDGLTTDAMSTDLEDGVSDGVLYTVKDPAGKTAYTVTATGSVENPDSVVFHINGQDYTGTKKTISRTRNELNENGEVLENQPYTGTYYSVTVNQIEYRMALADIFTDNTTTPVTKTLTWDLSPIGSLKKNYTYTAEVVVWPNQPAYDYVAGLNNHLNGYTWNYEDENPVYDPDNPSKVLYYKDGVPGHDSVVRKPDPEPDGTFTVLSNTNQEVYYSDVHSQSTNDIITTEETTPHKEPIPPVKPMDLLATETELEKEWSVDRNPALMAQFLYDSAGKSKEFSIEYGIYRDGDDDEHLYTSMTLGWDGEKYVWDPDSVRYVRYNGHRVPVGMRWSKDFSIASGLMLSKAKMDELRLDTSENTPYPHYDYQTDKGLVTYYLLEPGHDYTIHEIIPENEESWVTYDFDFVAPVYHPMLVDGKLKSVTFSKEAGEIIGIDSISKEDWMVSLKMQNIMRGYINIEKKVVYPDGVTAKTDDTTKFTYTIDLNNDADPGPFVDDSIPWYGINGLYYHEQDVQNDSYIYYQAEVTNSKTNKSHTLTLTTETGELYEAWCVGNGEEEGVDELDHESILERINDENLIFDEDVPGPTWITYRKLKEEIVEGEDEYEYITVKLFGNEMECAKEEIEVETEGGGTVIQTVASRNRVSAEFQISQDQILNLANIPLGTTYTIKEETEMQPGYSLINIRKEIRNGSTVESRTSVSGDDGEIAGTIVPDRDNHFVFTNKIKTKDIIVKKVDESGRPLSGAVFELKRISRPDGSEASDYDNGISKPASGERNTGLYTFYDLPDGSYTLNEASPPEGYMAISGSIAFTKTNGVISEPSNLPSGVTWDGETATFTVKNPESSESKITVRKQWLDANGNPTTFDGTLALTLKQWVKKSANNYTVRVNFQYVSGRHWDNGRWVNDITTYTYRTGAGAGLATISWQYFQWGVDASSITVNGIDRDEYSLSPESGSHTQYTLTINNVNDNMEINIGYNYNNLNPYVSVGDISISPAAADGYDQVGTKLITLGENDDWSKQFTVSGSNSMTEDTLPATNAQGKTYYYTIEEPSVPGYVLDTTLSDNLSTPVTSGVIAAYNKKTERGSLGVKKIVQASNSQLAGGNMYRANGRYNFTLYKVTSEDPLEAQPVKYVQIRVENGAATYKVAGSSIGYDDDTGFRWVYGEGAIVDDLIPGKYIVEETGYQLTNPDGLTMELAQIDVGGSGPNTVDLLGKKTTLTVTEGDIPTATSTFTNMLIPELDVPVVKTWSWSNTDEGNVAGWSATFNLEYREVLTSGVAISDAKTHWTQVYEADGVTPKRITITSQENPASGTFRNLPMYKTYTDEDGNISVYRIIYAVDEIAYTITPMNGTPKTWEKSVSGHLDQHYSPTYEQDAGELDQPAHTTQWTEWYTIRLNNSESTKEVKKYIDLSLAKIWENDTDNAILNDPESYAKFQLMRYSHEESLDLTNRGLVGNELVTVKLMQDTATISELVVPSGAPVYIAGVVKPGKQINLSFNNGSNTVSLTGGAGTSTGRQYIVSNNYFTAAAGLIVNLASGDTDDLVGGVNGLRLASFDEGDIQDFQPDSAFNNYPAGQEFTLSAEHGWQKDWVDLPQIVEERTDSGDHVVLKTIVYSYYLVEKECHPEKFSVVFKDGLGNSSNPLISSADIIAENKVSTTIIIRKIDEKTRTDATQTAISGAKFRLLKYTSGTDGSGGSYSAYDATYGAQDGLPVGDDGLLTFNDLPNGEYQIVETSAPDGYIKIENNDIYFNISNGVVTRYNKPVNYEPDPQDVNDQGRTVIPATVSVDNEEEVTVIAGISYEPDDEHAVAAFTVGNISGNALPSTGGPGTAMIYLLGILLTGIAGAGLLILKRRRAV